jgi:hypothetical protein
LITPDMLDKMNRYWRTANYLCIGQSYLFENSLLREPLKAEQIKPRLLRHWGTSPGQNLIYIHLNRLIKEHDADLIYIAGPGHGGPSLNANSYLEGSCTEVHPEITTDENGMRLLFRKFSTPGPGTQPLRTARPEFDARGRGAWLLACICRRSGTGDGQLISTSRALLHRWPRYILAQTCSAIAKQEEPDEAETEVKINPWVPKGKGEPTQTSARSDSSEM